MKKGKQTCKILKEIRRQIAAENDIELVIEECTYQGDCLGTCPKCEAEVRYLERELEKRQRMGKAAVFAGMSLGTLLATAACGCAEKMPTSNTNNLDSTEVVQNDTIPEPLMGIFPMYRAVYEYDAEAYQNLLQKKFVFPEMKNLSVVGGKIEYEHVKQGKACESLEELAEAAEEFKAPYYPEGEQDILMALSLQSKANVSKYRGEMEIAFTVDILGNLSDIEVVKGVNKTLDDAVVDVFKQMKWHPAYYQLKDEYGSMPFECRCVQKIHFPIELQ